MTDDSVRPSLPPEEHARWWRTVGEDELCQLLYWRWDPIGVSDVFPDTKGEYDDYAPPLMALLRDGGGVDDLAEYLRRVQVEWMGMEPPDTAVLREVADTVIGWYEGSVARWADGVPPA